MKTRILFWLLLALAGGAGADERILDFHDAVRVNADSSLDVTETIRVHGEGERIKHGLLRDFPTDYRDAHGTAVRVEFEMLDAQRDGHVEHWRSEAQANGVRVYLGDAARILPTGDYEYTLHYRTAHQLGFFDNHDELYWNATGNGWNFPIEHASVAVTLPDAIAPAQLRLTAFTGAEGAKGKAWRASADAPSHATFETTARLARHEGLTIAVAFPKGLVTPPRVPLQLFNPALWLGVLGLGAVLTYYFRTWQRVGRDPRAAPVMPMYEAPKGKSPATLRYAERRRYDDRCFAADLIDLAVRGTLKIQQPDRKTYVLTKTATAAATIPAPEFMLHRNLFDNNEDEQRLDRKPNAAVAYARSHHADGIAKISDNTFFRKNRDKMTLGAGMSLATLLVVNLASTLRDTHVTEAAGYIGPLIGVVFTAMFGVVAVIIGGVIARSAIVSWRSARGIRQLAGTLLLVAVVPAALGAIAFGVFLLGAPSRWLGIVLAAALFAANAAAWWLLPAPTAAGRRLLDEIAGLRLYLGVAEHDTIVNSKAPPMNFDEFQRFLPYALALDVEHNWTDRFSVAVGPAAAAAAAATGVATWYVFDQTTHGSTPSISDFASNLGSSFSDTISSSATMPGSTSAFGSSDSGGSSSDSGGSSDSGSSGGGGGGGGGDGW